MPTDSAYVIWVMCGATLELVPATQPRLALLCPQIGVRRHWLSLVQHCAAICGLRIRVLAAGTSVTERTLSIPGLKQKVMMPSSPPSITCTPPAGMRVSTEPGGEAFGGGESAGGGGGGGGGGDASHVRMPPEVQVLPFVPASGLWHSFLRLASSFKVT